MATLEPDGHVATRGRLATSGDYRAHYGALDCGQQATQDRSIAWGVIFGALLGLGVSAITVGPLTRLIESSAWLYASAVLVLLGIGVGIITRKR